MDDYDLSSEIRYDLDHVTAPGLQTLMGHWRDCLSAGQDMPTKSSIDAEVLGSAGLLPFVWIIEAPDDGPPYYRLAGEEIGLAFGHSMKNRTIYEVFEPTAAAAIERRWRRLLAENLFSHTIGEIYSETGLLYIGERIGLPLCDDAGKPLYVLGCTVHSQPDGLHSGGVLKRYRERESCLTPTALIRDLL